MVRLTPTFSGRTITYVAPAAPPVYSENTPSGLTNYHGSGSGMGSQGIASVEASVVVPGTGAMPRAGANFAIAGPMSTGIAPTTASHQLGKLLSFTDVASAQPTTISPGG